MIRGKLTYANVVATLVLFLVLGTAGAWAASKLINGSRIKPHTITGRQIRKGSLRASVFAAGAVPQSMGPTGASGAIGPTGVTGPAGSARAYGRVTQGGVISASKNVVGNAQGGPGIYCITLDPSVDANTADVLASPDFELDTTSTTAGTQSIVEWSSNPSRDCPPGNLIEVKTFTRGTGPSFAVTVANNGFSFMVP